MSATPEPEVRWWRQGVAVQAFPESAAPYLPGMGWTEVTVTPVDGLRPDSDAIERAARLLHALQWMGDQEDADAAWDRYPITSATRSDYLRTAEALAAAGLLIPSDTFASTKPSDAEHLLSVVETIKETGGSVQIRGVLITPCDTYGQPLTSVLPDADVAERITLSTTGDLDALPDGSVVLDGRGRVSQKFSSRWHRSGAAEGGRTPERVLRYGSVALLWSTPPVAIEVEWEWHLRDESGVVWRGPFASEEQAQAARRESRPHWIVVRRRRAGPWVEVPPVAATSEEDDRG